MNYHEQLNLVEQQFRLLEPKATLLATALSAAVPLSILELLRRGGITESDIIRIQSYLKDLTEHGDDLLFRSTRRGESARRFEQVVEIIAVLSFLPGGISVFGHHFEAHAPSIQEHHPDNGHDADPS